MSKSSSSLIHRYYLILKAHYFFSYASFAAFGPIMNIILRSRGLSDVEISYINLAIPFSVFFTNPLVGFLADHTRRFRLIFNIALCLGTILFIIMFFLPSIKAYNIHGGLYQTDTMEYSLNFCANKQFATKCALKSQCGCIYQANCTSLIMRKNNADMNISDKSFNFNFTMNSTYIKQKHKNVSSTDDNEHAICEINYRVPIEKYTKDKILDSFDNKHVLSSSKSTKLAKCDVKCSTDHLCHGSRFPRQTIYVLLYAFLIVIGLNLCANATTIGTSIGFAALHRSNLFGRQRVYGTMGFGLCAFIASRIYAHFKSDYIYIFMFVASSILTVIITSFVHIRSDKHNTEKSNQDDLSVIEELNETSINENEQKSKPKNSPFKICAILPLLKNFDVMVFLATTFLWGTSYGGMDPYLLLYIDEISPCVSHSIVGYMSLITSTVEVIALFVAHKLIKYLGTKISSILIFIAFIIRFTGYYFIRRPYLLLPLETMHFFNFGILYVLIAQQALEI
ncbi:unnamed protein product, partial [Adineta steineri]